MGGDKVSRIRLFALAVGGLAAVLAGCASTEPSAEVRRLQAQNAYERGLSFVRDGQPAPALAALQEAVRLDPSRAIYRDALGVVLLDLGRLDQAIEVLSEAVSVDPGLADAHFHLGTALAEARRWEEAVASYQKAVALPTLTVPAYAYQNLGLALYHTRKYAEAEKALRFALNLDPNLQAAFYNLGLVLTARNRPEEAKQSFRQARQLAPDTEILPHRHAWAQVVLCASGVARITAGDHTYLVPGWRAVWIPAGIEHLVTVVEAAELRTLYIHQEPGRTGPGGLARVSHRAGGGLPATVDGSTGRGRLFRGIAGMRNRWFMGRAETGSRK